MLFGLGSVIGIFGGVAQDVLGWFKQKHENETQHKYNLELEDKRTENRIKEFQAGLLQEQEKTKQQELIYNAEQEKTRGVEASAEASVLISDNDFESTRMHNITQATQYVQGEGFLAGLTNFIIATTRPFQTYLLLIGLFACIVMKVEAEYVEYIALLAETCVSFWFYKRSSEKFMLKKK